MPCLPFNAAICLCLLTCLYCCTEARRRLCGKALADTLDLVCADRGFNLAKRNGRSTRPESMLDIKGQVPSQSAHNTDRAAGNNFHGTMGENNMMNSLGRPRYNIHSTHKTTNGSVLLRMITSFLNSKDAGGSASTDKNISLTDSRRNKNISNSTRQDRYHTIIKNESYKARLRRSRNGGTSVVDECCFRACSFSTLESYCAAVTDPEIELSMSELRQRLGFNTPVASSLRQSVATSAADSQPSPVQQHISLPSAQMNRGAQNQSHFFYVSVGNHATRSPLLQK